MKKLCLVVACVSLISCIPVDDFGSYWDKAGADPQLAGTWKRIAANPQQTREQGYSTGDVMRLVAKDGQYDLTDDAEVKERTYADQNLDRWRVSVSRHRPGKQDSFCDIK